MINQAGWQTPLGGEERKERLRFKVKDIKGVHNRQKMLKTTPETEIWDQRAKTSLRSETTEEQEKRKRVEGQISVPTK